MPTSSPSAWRSNSRPCHSEVGRRLQRLEAKNERVTDSEGCRTDTPVFGGQGHQGLRTDGRCHRPRATREPLAPSLSCPEDSETSCRTLSHTEGRTLCHG